MIISNIAVEKRVTVYVMTVILAIAGYISYMLMPREAEPEVVIPYIFVSTNYRGVSAEIIETQITKKIEDKLKGMDDVKEILSSSYEGTSEISVEFVDGTDIDKAESDVKDAVDRAKTDLPSDLDDDPLVYDINLSETPFYIFAIKGSDKRTLRKIAEDMEESIEAIPGVLEVDVSGGFEREIHVEIDPMRMALYGIDMATVASLVAGENSDFSGGSIRTKEAKFQIKIDGEFQQAKDAEHIVVASRADGSPIYLNDIATIEDGNKDLDSDGRVDGLDSVNVYVKKKSGENIVQLVSRVRAKIAESEQGWPKGVTYDVLEDKGERVENQIADLENNIITGLLLVVLVVCFAMGMRNAILVSLSIPFSMLISFIILRAIGVTLNMVVLFGLTIALGMLVDNAVVIIENIYRFMQSGMGRLEAAKKATGEVAWAIIGSSLTTMGAYFPLILWNGIMGQFMRYIPITVIVTLASCLFVALVINPAMAAGLMKVRKKRMHKVLGEHAKNDNFFIAGYRRILRSFLGLSRDGSKQRIFPRVSILLGSGLALVLAFSFWMYRIGYNIPVEFFPSTDPEKIELSLTMPSGASLGYCDDVLKEAEARFSDKDHDKHTYEKSIALKEHKDKFGKAYKSISDIPNIDFTYSKADSLGGDNSVTIEFIDMEKRTVRSFETIKELEKRVETLTGADFTLEEEEMGPPTGAAVEIEISGDDLGVLAESAIRFKKVLEGIPFTRNISDDAGQSKPTLKLDIDRKRAALLGLSSSAIGQVLSTAINGINVDDFRDGDDDYDILVRLDDKSRTLVDTLSQLFIPTASGTLVPLSTVTRLSYTNGIGKIKRKDHKRVVTVSADVDETKTSGAAVRTVLAKKLAEMNFTLPTGYTYKFSGEDEDQKEASDFLLYAGGISIALIFFILVAQFNSVIYPFIIMTSVILSLTGIFFGLGVFKMPFGIIMTGVGVISLAGVVVNNSIVLIEYIIQLRNEGMSLTTAIEEACVTRLRPVLLTTITTVLGFMPMVTGISWDFHPSTFGIQFASESTQMWQPMAVAMMFGLIFATVLTLLTLPSLVSLVETAKKRLGLTATMLHSSYKGVRRGYKRFVIKRLR